MGFDNKAIGHDSEVMVFDSRAMGHDRSWALIIKP